jgi:hypothetical protein
MADEQKHPTSLRLHGASHHTGHAVLPHDRVPWRQEHRHKELMFFAGVGLSVLIILALYAASFHYQPLFQDLRRPAAEIQNAKEDLMTRTSAIQQQFAQLADVKDRISAVLNAKVAQDQSIALMKNLIQSATATASATSTTH